MVTVVQKKLILIGLVSFTLYLLMPLEWIKSDIYYFFFPRYGIQCYRTKSANSLPDISEANPTKGNAIFFHETSCNSHLNGKITINSRQACAVESAAKMNPNREIYLLYASPGNFDFQGTESDRFLKALLSYGNVKIYHLDFEKYSKNTPVEQLYKSGKIDRSRYALSHASDVLRYLTLWKYGGIYLDLDVVVIKSFEGLPQNFAGAESDRNVAAGAMGFAPDGIGHSLARYCLNDLREHFNAWEWGYNGPGVITRLLKNICGAEKAKDMIVKDCQGFTVLPTEKFYPIAWWNWTMYFDEKANNEISELTRNSYIIHVWNKHSVNLKIPINSRVPYLKYAEKYCPKVLKKCDSFF